MAAWKRRRMAPPHARGHCMLEYVSSYCQLRLSEGEAEGGCPPEERRRGRVPRRRSRGRGELGSLHAEGSRGRGRVEIGPRLYEAEGSKPRPRGTGLRPSAVGAEAEAVRGRGKSPRPSAMGAKAKAVRGRGGSRELGPRASGACWGQSKSRGRAREAEGSSTAEGARNRAGQPGLEPGAFGAEAEESKGRGEQPREARQHSRPRGARALEAGRREAQRRTLLAEPWMRVGGVVWDVHGSMREVVRGRRELAMEARVARELEAGRRKQEPPESSGVGPGMIGNRGHPVMAKAGELGSRLGEPRNRRLRGR